MVVTIVAVFAGHCFASLLVDAYRNLLFEIGRTLVHGNDIADMPQIVLAGFAVVGAAVEAVALVAERLTWYFRDPSDRSDYL